MRPGRKLEAGCRGGWMPGQGMWTLYWWHRRAMEGLWAKRRHDDRSLGSWMWQLCAGRQDGGESGSGFYAQSGVKQHFGFVVLGSQSKIILWMHRNPSHLCLDCMNSDAMLVFMKKCSFSIIKMNIPILEKLFTLFCILFLIHSDKQSPHWQGNSKREGNRENKRMFC